MKDKYKLLKRIVKKNKDFFFLKYNNNFFIIKLNINNKNNIK